MSRPRIVRADTLDLQDHDAPSAKDHITQNLNPISEGGGIAPHQEQSIRHADETARSEMMNGPLTDEIKIYGDGIDIYANDDMDDHHDEDGDATDGEGDDMMDDDMMDKISSSPSIDDEDIDFEFVYALHNFVATVEGQANAAKGDTMVLLDDSNTYWWLVRIVKDGSIGYLPAEHIETPTERLARLNKHRNVDLSATMLGDNSEKSKNPLKKAMRRRNTKTVVFTSPTYIEASDVEYSSDEESDDDAFFIDNQEPSEAEPDESQEGRDDDMVVQPLRTKGQKEKETEDESSPESEEVALHLAEDPQPHDETMEYEDGTVSRSRNGTVRNTDSFFKDDTAEPKKISLTPNLLRDEGGNSIIPNEIKEDRSSMETIEKTLSAGDKTSSKDDKKRKDKKPGMLSGLFKRKDKKTRTSEDDAEDQEKNSFELSRSPPPSKTSLESISSPESRSKSPASLRQSGKLQKQPPGPMSPTGRDPQYDAAAQEASRAAEAVISPKKGKNDKWIRQVVPEEREEELEAARETMASPNSVSGVAKQYSSPFGNGSTVTSPVMGDSRVVQNAFAARDQQARASPQKVQPPQNAAQQNRSLESPIDVSPVDPSGAPGLVEDLSPAKQSDSPVSPPSSPGADTNGARTEESGSASSPQTPTWNDASLRSYLDDDNDIRDLFIIVHDKSNVPPAGPDHPITGSLFKEESKRLKEMTGTLDDMLSEWVSRRSKSQMV